MTSVRNPAVRTTRVRTSRSRNSRSNRFNPLAHVLVWFYALLLLIPLYFMIISAFKDNADIFNSPFAFPTSLSFDNFTNAWTRASMGPGLINSALVTVIAEIITLVLAIPAAYAIARAGGRIGGIVEKFFAAGLLIPGFAALVPTVILSIALQLFHTREFLYLFLPATVLPLSVILLTQFMRSVPAELEESAMMDGANRLRVLISIYIPITIPGIATIAILNFLTFWNEYLYALILAGPDPDVRTVQVALPGLVSQTYTQYGVLLAGALITMVPVYIVYIILNRRLEDALLQGAVKS
ncbi:carbohydrate ABC transporter permease [Subtercola lobariae]|uniref:Transporter n=1 Tax=Subtercola lobariae TaxID=1588641 RepID=A0A917B3F6_9MICO|nr:carbohydrate ABC transporter permease [Subtercola lobariae]GGF20813.1 transporter [Subtercola lobariae]